MPIALAELGRTPRHTPGAAGKPGEAGALLRPAPAAADPGGVPGTAERRAAAGAVCR